MKLPETPVKRDFNPGSTENRWVVRGELGFGNLSGNGIFAAVQGLYGWHISCCSLLSFMDA
jgi:hypothetical protein